MVVKVFFCFFIPTLILRSCIQRMYIKDDSICDCLVLKIWLIHHMSIGLLEFVLLHVCLENDQCIV